MNGAKNLPENDLGTFTLHFAAKGISEPIAKRIYQFLREEIVIPEQLPLCFSDDIYLRYGIVDDDLERLAEDLAALLDRRLPPPTLEKSGKPMVYTIEDLILFVWSCPTGNG